MFWDGTKWVDEKPKQDPQSAKRPDRRFRDWISTGVMGMLLVALIIPVVGTSASDSATRLTSTWATNFTVKAYSEKSAKIKYEGRWTQRFHKGYAGDLASASEQRGASASITFTGSGIAWVGPTGPTRGRAKVYLDGKLVTVVNAYARRFHPTAVLFKKSFADASKHTLRIEVAGTKGHPTIAIDQMLVRGIAKVDQETALARKPRKPRATPRPTPTAEAKPAATATPTAVPTAVPTALPAGPSTPAPTAVPTATAAATPTATPVATPKPTPTPTPTPVPTATPTAAPPSGGTTVPSSIDATCGSNVSSALNSWIASKPNGSTLVFPSGSCYHLGGDAGLNLKGRNGLTLVGTGSTLQLRTTGATNFSSAFFLQDSDNITVRGFKVDGMNTATGTTGAASAINEHINGAAIRAGSNNVEFDRVTWDRIKGFGIIISSDGGSVWPSDISIHDSTVRGGEMGIAIVAGQRIQLVRNHIVDSVYIAIDLEPDYGTDGYRDVLIKDNEVTRYSWGQNLTSWFVAANPADAAVSAAVMDGLTITGNKVHVGAATADNGNADGIGGLGIRADKANVKRNVVITNNTTGDNDTQSASRGVIYLANVQNLTVTGNRQPIANGAAFVRDSGTTGTRSVSGNDVSP